MALKAKFRKGDAVRWNAHAFTDDEQRRGWVIQGLSVREGLMPCYHVLNVVTGRRGDAAENELEGPIMAGLQLGKSDER